MYSLLNSLSRSLSSLPPLFLSSLLPSILFLPKHFLFYQHGSGLTHNNQLTDESDSSEVTEVIKKVLDERMTRQHQIREQVSHLYIVQCCTVDHKYFMCKNFIILNLCGWSQSRKLNMDHTFLFQNTKREKFIYLKRSYKAMALSELPLER